MTTTGRCASLASSTSRRHQLRDNVESVSTHSSDLQYVLRESDHQTLASRRVVLAQRLVETRPHLDARQPELVVPEARLGVERQDAGVRHLDGAESVIANLACDDGLAIELDSGNAWDPRALRLCRGATTVGFIPHMLLDDIHAMRRAGTRVTVRVVRVNPPPAPVHQRLLVVLHAFEHPGFVPFSSPRYEPLIAPESMIVTPGLVAERR